MARRRRESDHEEKETDWGFEVEPLDEDDVVLKEARGFRSTLVVIGWSIVAAAVSFFLWRPMEGSEYAWEVGLLVGLGVGALLKWVLPLAKVPTGDFRKREWFGTGMTFFFSWLAFFLLFTNPPLHDGTEPAFQITASPRLQELGGEVLVTVVVGDNAGVRYPTVDLAVYGPGGAREPGAFEVRDRPGHYLWRGAPAAPGLYEVRGEATDVNGNRGSALYAFRVVPVDGAVTVRLPEPGGRFDDLDDRLLVRIADCAKPDPCLDVYRVLVEVDGGPTVVMKFDRESRAWTTSPRVEGNSSWGGAGNKSLRVLVEEHATYQHGLEGAAVAKGPYAASVEATFPLEEGKEPRVKKRPDLREAPGFDGAVAFAGLALAGFALAMRRRRNGDA